MGKKHRKKNRKKSKPKEREQKRFHLNTASWAIIIFLLALILRLVFLFGFRASSPEFFSSPFLDSKFYVEEALKILNNTFFEEKTPFLLSPLYTVFLALYFKTLGVSFLGVRLVQVVLGSLMVVFVYLTGKRFFNASIGLIAGFAAALYPPFIYFDSMLLLASLQTTFLVISLFVLLEALYRKSKFLYVIYGLLMGVTVALRPNTLLVYGTVLLFLILRKKEKRSKRLLYAVLSLAGILLIITPFMIINCIKSGEVIPLSANGGFNFWIGNNAQATGVFITPPGYKLNTDPLYKYHLEKQVGRNLTYREASSIYFSKTLDDIKSNPSRFIILMWTKARLFFHHSELPQLGMDFNYLKRFSPVTKIPFGFIIVGLFGLFGLVCSAIPSWKQNDNTMGVLHVYFIAYIFSIILFFVNARYRLPAIPILMISSAYGLRTIFDFISSRKYHLLSAVSVILAVILLFLLTMPQVSLQNFSGVLNHEGMALFTSGKLDEAISKYRQAIAIHEKPAYIMNLANALKAKGNYTEALNMYGKAIALEPHDYLHYYNRGNLFLNITKEYDKAEADYLKSLVLNPLFFEARLNLAVLYFQNTGKLEQSKENCQMLIQQAVPGNPLRNQAEKILSLIRLKQNSMTK